MTPTMEAKICRHRSTSLNCVRLLDYVRPADYGPVVEIGFDVIMTMALQTNSNLEEAMVGLTERAVDSWQLVQYGKSNQWLRKEEIDCN